MGWFCRGHAVGCEEFFEEFEDTTDILFRDAGECEDLGECTGDAALATGDEDAAGDDGWSGFTL